MCVKTWCAVVLSCELLQFSSIYLNNSIMRVTVNLSIFFHDHRSIAKIYINKNLKTIRDVEKHISSIFKIHDFYLKCENQYLPPTEDVQVLHNDDLIWATPKNKQEQSTIDVSVENMSCNQDVTGVAYNLDARNTYEEKSQTVGEIKRKGKKERSEIVCDTSTCEEVTPVVYKKKKKRQKETQELDLDFNKEKEDNQLVVKNAYMFNKTSSKVKDKNKTRKRSILEPQESDELTQAAGKTKRKKIKDTEEITTGKILDITTEKSRTETGKGQDPPHLHTDKCKSESMECDADNNNFVNVSKQQQPKPEQTSSTEMYDACKTESTSYSICENSGIKQQSKLSEVINNHAKQLPTMPLQKKINIVNTIIISKSGAIQSASPQRPSSILMSSVTDSIIAEVVPENDSSMIPDSSLRSSVFNSNCEVVPENVHDLVEIDDANVTRNGTLGEVSENDLPSPILHSTSSKKLGFQFQSPNSDLSNVARNTDVEDTDRKKRKRKRTHRRKRNNTTDISVDYGVGYQNVSQVVITPNPRHIRFEDGQQTEEIIRINESHENEPTFEIDSLTTSLIESGEQAEQFEKDIAKHPIIQNMDPKVNDVIAFKILRMSENYSPEVSSNIVGKVLKFGPENKEITFKILRGRNQCLQPQGKFSLGSEEGDEVQTDTFHGVWPDLLEPRLLFP